MSAALLGPRLQKNGVEYVVKDLMGQKRMDEMLALGQANCEVLRQLDRWCKHLEVQMTSAGMLAGMSGLPIGSHRLSCQHATHGLESMNLPWVSRDFLDQNCRSCPHHEPDGDPQWGQDVLVQVETARAETAQREKGMQAAVEEVRRRCRAQAEHGRKDDNLTEHQILAWTEQVFESDAGKARAAAGNLAEAAKVAPDLFGEAVVGALCGAAPTVAFHEAALPALADLAGKRPDLAGRLTDTAVAAIEAGVGLEHASAIFTKIRPEWSSEARRRVIERVLGVRNHIRPIGGWRRRDPQCDLIDIPPDYSLSDSFLAQEHDRDAETVLGVIKDAVRLPDPDRRINACGVVRGLMGLRPQVGVVLAPVVAGSLELVENEFGESADDVECKTLAQAFLIDPEAIDGILSGCMESRGPPVQEQLIEVYTRVLRAKVSAVDDDDSDPAAPDEVIVRTAVAIALRRVLHFLQDEQLDIDPLLAAAQAIHAASCHHPEQLIEHHPILLGTMAAWSLQSQARPAPPTILVPGAGSKPPGLVAMEEHSRDLRWQNVKRELGNALSELVEAYPQRLADTLIETFANLDSKTHYAFKGEVTRLLGVLGKQYDLLPRVLPSLWSALMDSSSAVVRYRGTDAFGECFGRSRQAPPRDVVDVFVLHLNDSYIAVHQAALRVVGDNADWLTEAQAIEALQRLANLVRTYKSERPFELERIADALLHVSRRVPRARLWSVNQVLPLIPSGVKLLDKQLIERLVRGVRPAEPAARAVAPVVLRWVGADESDTDDFRDKTNEAFSWLHNLPPAFFREVCASAIEQARKTAKHYRRAISFASLFAAHEDYEMEREVLTLARSHLPSGRRFEEVARAMEKLADAAGRSAARLGAGRD
ncbi:MAG: hypothetical protein JNM56_06890 [Planctomycetia bacterium]|nr:hypothetical protein [Planctomycetia bacterium]